MNESSRIRDAVAATMDRGRGTDNGVRIVGRVVAELFDEHGNLKARDEVSNLVTAVGDRLYASRGAGLSTSAIPTGMRLGTGSTAVAKTGAGAAIVTYLATSNKAFDATFPSETGGVVTYKRTYAAGEATSGSAITEVVINTDTITNDNATTATAANTISRALLTGIGSKGASDTLTITWTHTILGA
jgi:hypothetical protein